jgi:site-specific DNA-methyltransferase (adenine-specific)
MILYDVAITDVAYSVPSIEVWSNCLQSLKPGAHLLAFCSTANHHRNTANIEDAGFEVRDSIAWMFDGEGLFIHPDLNLIAMARKPLDCNTVASNVLKWGTGALNIDGCRVEGRERTEYGLANSSRSAGNTYGAPSASADFDASKGRWPANIILESSESIVGMFPQAKGAVSNGRKGVQGVCYSGRGAMPRQPGRADSGSAARFFHQVEPDGPRPPALIAYLHKLITPPGGTAYDPVGTLSDLLSKMQGP